jgi:hypothetical protein
MDSVQAAFAMPVEPVQQTPNVTVDQGNAFGADFSQVLEGFRQRAAKIEEAGMLKPAGGPTGSGGPETNADRSIRQLAELYTYAVDMQVLVRTGGQLTSGMRQLITGQ